MEEVMTIPMSVGNTEPIPMSVENEEQIPMGMDMQIVAGGSVYSVNGQTGDVVLTASDVDALPSTTEIPSKTSDLQNDSGYLTSAVTSFNGQSGAVTYTAPVSSVNGQTGSVVLTASDVGALADTTTIPTKTSDLTNDSGYITGMTILSYGSSTWQDFLTAYNANRVVYCRASSNANPASGSQTRMAFLAYVSNATNPTSAEFQYYRSVSSHTASQQGDQVFIYTLKSTGWSVAVREASVKVAAGTGISMAYSNGTATLSANIADATTSASGLMSATDKANLDTLMDDYSSALVALGVTS